MHHIITDEWSMEIFKAELADYYLKLCNKEVLISDHSKIQFCDFAYWDQSKTVDNDQLKILERKAFWRHSNTTVTNGFKRPVKPSFKGSHKNSKVFT